MGRYLGELVLLAWLVLAVLTGLAVAALGDFG